MLSLSLNKWIYIVIILFSLLFRFYHAQQLFIFSADEEHQLSIAQTIVKHFHIEWVGVSSADTGFYLGPFWEYFGAFWLFLSHGNPDILPYVAGCIGIATTVLVLIVGSKLFSTRVAMIAGSIYAFSPLLIYYDRRFWNPAFTSFASLALLLALYQTKTNKYWWILVGFIYGMVFHVHLSLVPLGWIIVYLIWLQRKKIGWKVLAASSLTFVLAMSPLLGFDYLHNWSNITTPFRVLNQVKASPQRINPLGHLDQLSNSLGRIFYLELGNSNYDELVHGCRFDEVATFDGYSQSSLLLSFIVLIPLAWFLFRKHTWSNTALRLIALFISTMVTTFIFLPNTPLEYYLLGLFPLYILIFSEFVNSFKNIRWLVIFLLILFFGQAIITLIKADESLGLDKKSQLVKQVSGYIGVSSFELKDEGVCHKYGGWRFLFKAYGRLPQRSSSDESLGWLYPFEIKPGAVKYVVIITEPSVIIANFEKKFSSGKFDAYIIKN